VTEAKAKTKISMPVVLAVTGRVLLLPAVIALIGYLWLAVALGGGSPTWIEQLVLMSPVAFTAYWALGWRPRNHTVVRRILLGITFFLLLPALILVFALEPWQRAQMQRQNALFFNQSQLESALEQHVCPDGNILVITPWLFILDGEASRRLVELRVIPSERQRPSRLLGRTTARGEFARQEALATEYQAVAACVGDDNALEGLLQRMAEGAFE
jgi:hypothetical protein